MTIFNDVNSPKVDLSNLLLMGMTYLVFIKESKSCLIVFSMKSSHNYIGTHQTNLTSTDICHEVPL